MKRNNKGYTLVELLLTMAIFSIVMIGVINIMTNASKAYKKGLIEVKVQEEAQIVTNQISDLLIDSTSIVESATVVDEEGITPAYTTYNFTDADGNSITLEYADKKINLIKDGEKALISDNVKSFAIVGVKGTSNVEAQKTDNLCEVRIQFEMDNGSKDNDSFYETKREVTFRNHVESNPDEIMLMTKSSDDDDDSDEEFNGTETVKFGGDVNLSASYDIVSNAVLSGPAQQYFDLVKVENGAFGKDVYKVKLKPSYDNPVSFSSLNLNSNDIYVYGTDPNGNAKKIKLETEPVSISAESGVLLLTLDNVNHGGGNTTYVPVKGIDVNEFIHNGGSVSVKAEYTVGGNTFSNNFINLPYVNSNQSAYTNNGVIQQVNVNWNSNANKGRFEVGLSPDQCSGGMSVVTNNTSYFKEAGSLPTDAKVKFTVRFSKNGFTQEYPIEYSIQFTEQQDLTKFQK